MDNQLVRQAVNELRYLRQENRVLSAIADTVAAFSLALNAHPPSQGVSPDLVWQLERELAKDEQGEGE